MSEHLHLDDCRPMMAWLSDLRCFPPFLFTLLLYSSHLDRVMPMLAVQSRLCYFIFPSDGGFGLAWVGFLGQECEGISSSRGQRLGYASLPPTELFPFKNTPQETTSNNHIPHRERSAPLLELGKTSPFPS
ncbi:unnamed protein product [Leuciscus chuanchicus]